MGTLLLFEPLWHLAGPDFRSDTCDLSEISMCIYGVTDEQIPDEVKLGKTDRVFGQRLCEARYQATFGFADRRQLVVQYVLLCNGKLSPAAVDKKMKSCFEPANVRCGRGHEQHAISFRDLVSRLREMTRTGHLSEYAPQKKLRQLMPGELSTALKADLGIGKKIVLLSPCLADLGVNIKAFQHPLGWIVIRSEVRLSRLQYHSRDPRGSYGYWKLPLANDDYLYLLSYVRGLGLPEKCRLADGQEAPAATLVVEEYFTDTKEGGV